VAGCYEGPVNALKVELSRDALARTAPFTYTGTVQRGVEKIQVDAVLHEDGTVTVSSSDKDIAERVRLLLRAVHKQTVSEGLPAPPRKIVRWREERV
jgi:hypothetical protein